MAKSTEPLQVPISEVCELLSYSPRTIHKMIKQGTLKANGKGSGMRVTMASIREYIEQAGGNTPTVSYRSPYPAGKQLRQGRKVSSNSDKKRADDSSGMLRPTGPKLKLEL